CLQAEDGIRDWSVTGVQTCALPISSNLQPVQRRDSTASPESRQRPRKAEAIAAAPRASRRGGRRASPLPAPAAGKRGPCAAREQIGRASCRERGEGSGGGGAVKERG